MKEEFVGSAAGFTQRRHLGRGRTAHAGGWGVGRSRAAACAARVGERDWGGVRAWRAAARHVKRRRRSDESTAGGKGMRVA